MNYSNGNYDLHPIESPPLLVALLTTRLVTATHE